LALKRSISSIGVSYETTRLVVSHLNKVNIQFNNIESPLTSICCDGDCGQASCWPVKSSEQSLPGHLPAERSLQINPVLSQTAPSDRYEQ
jgi:hypothetical protein